MNIAIITFHCSYNYGSALQAYALQTYLEKQGHKVQIIDYILSDDFKQYKLIRPDRYLKKPKFLFADIYFLPKTLKRKRNFEEFQKSYLKLTDKKYYDNDDMSELNSRFDAFICGSDQIWNTGCTKYIIEPYFLSFVSDERLKISYAPSIAQIHDDVSEQEKNKLRELVNRLDYISVREKSTIPYISQITDKPVTDVLDPTLLLEQSDYNKILPDSSKAVKEKYIFFYTLQKNPEMTDYCRKLSEEKNLKVLYISKVNIKSFGNSENIYGCSPQEFLYYIKNAEYIVTNSFHATVFSVVFEKKFMSFGTKKSFVRMLDLLNGLGLEKRLYSEKKAEDIDEEIDYKQVKKNKCRLTEHSEEFLNNSLNLR